MKTIEVKYIDTTKYIVRVYQDEGSESPTEWGNFEIVTFFRNKLVTDRDPSEYQDEEGKLLPSVKAKLQAGKMFWLDIYEHGATSYSLAGEGMQDRFDTSSNAGLIILDDEFGNGLTYAERKKLAKQCLQEYSDWANGYVYGAVIETDTGLEIDSSCGLIGYEPIEAFVEEAIDGAEYEIIEQ